MKPVQDSYGTMWREMRKKTMRSAHYWGSRDPLYVLSRSAPWVVGLLICLMVAVLMIYHAAPPAR